MVSAVPLEAAVRRLLSSSNPFLRSYPLRNNIRSRTTNASNRSLSSIPRRAPLIRPQIPSTSVSDATKPHTKRYSSSSWLLSALPNLSAASPPQTLHASRVLSYPPSQIYTLIADVGAYRAFLPHCSSSLVRAWATPTGQEGTPRSPALADLTVGWGPFTETYTSRVYCVPPGKGEDGAGIGIVEAVSGKAHTTISPETLQTLGYNATGKSSLPSVESGIFESLVMRWTVRPVIESGKSETSSEVTLTVKFQFANAMLGHAVGQIAKEKVDEMVQAFENRAAEPIRIISFNRIDFTSNFVITAAVFCGDRTVERQHDGVVETEDRGDDGPCIWFLFDILQTYDI